MIAIHHRPGSFSDKWINYCNSNGVNYVLIDLFDNNIIERLKEKQIHAVLFHFGTGEYKTDLILKSLSYLLESNGIKVFPGVKDYWHYDDKLKQKYLFEQLDIPHVPMYAFYNKEKAREWVQDHATYPFVFKLRGGAQSSNVILVKNQRQANKLVNKMFGRGITPVRSVLKDVNTKINKHKKKKDWAGVLMRLPKTLMKNWQANNMLPHEKGYFLAQDFIGGLDRDYRVKIVDGKCTAMVRHVRKNDFRASGSGSVTYDPKAIPTEIISLSFALAKKLEMRSVAFDFVIHNKKALLLEISYCYPVYKKQLHGYWTEDLQYHEIPFEAENFILNSLLTS